MHLQALILCLSINPPSTFWISYLLPNNPFRKRLFQISPTLPKKGLQQLLRPTRWNNLTQVPCVVQRIWDLVIIGPQSPQDSDDIIPGERLCETK